jgi:ribonucleoside-diphosphate reductase alpha chain
MVRVAGGEADIDWERLRHTVRVGVRFLDDVLEVNRDHLPEIAQATRCNRKIGLGVMGFAESLILLGVPYDAPEAITWADRVMRFIRAEAFATSRQLARLRGTSRPGASGSRASRSTVRARRRAKSSRSASTRTPPPQSSSPSAIRAPAASSGAVR